MVVRAGFHGTLGQPSAQVIDGSLKFDKGKSQHLKRTPGSAGNRKIFTWSAWLKRSSNLGAYNGLFFAGSGSTDLTGVDFKNTDEIRFTDTSLSDVVTSQVFRDVGTGWYHIVFAVDVTQGTNANKVKVYVNGTQVTSFSASNYPSNADQNINNTDEHLIGKRTAASEYFDGMMSQVYLIDGQQLDASYFGFTDPLTNTWKPKKYTGDFGSKAVFNAPLNATPFTDSIGSTITNNGNVSTASANTNTFGITTAADFGGDGRLTTTLTPPSTFTCDVYFDHNNSTGDSYVLGQGSGAFIQVNPSGVTTNIVLYGSTNVDLGSYGFKHLRIQFDGTTTTVWSNGSQVYSNTLSPGSGVIYVGAHATAGTRYFTGQIGPVRFTPNLLGAPPSGGLSVNSDGTLSDFIDAGSNSFYLPLDGNSPIGQDKSGNGNDFTAVNLGVSVALDSPAVSGARPILNTLGGGGTQAGVGVFGSRENIVYTVTVSNPGSGNKYYLDGVEAPTLSNLIRGATYTFDQSDSSNGSHPLVFGSTAEGNNFARGALYGSISAGTAGAATTITIPYDAPETLYYHCSAHSGMGGSIVGIHTDETKADQYASNCVFALPILGNEDVSASIACTMSNASITNSGVDFVTTYSNFYGASGDFTGASSDALYTGDDDTKFKMEEEDFTVECWVYSTSSSGTQNVCQIYGNSGSKYYGIYWNGSSLRFYVTGTGGPGDVSAGDIVFGKSRWFHLALVRNGSTLKGYVDGVEVASDSISSDIDETGYQAYVGRHSPANNGFTGYIQDFRVYKGVAKYTGDFVVPSPSPDILPDTPSGVSGSSKLTKNTDGSVSFDGTNDYLIIADSDDFNLGSGAFTIEGFCYLRSSSAQQFLVGMWTGNQLSYAVQTSNDSNRYLRFLISDDGTSVDFDKVSTGSLRLNGWSHFAVTRSGNTFYLFVDGILVGTQSASNTLHNSTGSLAIGARNDGTQDLNGFISNVRIIKGTALYTSRFTPPTKPLTNVTNTKLLCCQSPTSAAIAAVTPNVPGSGINDGTIWSANVSASTGSIVDAGLGFDGSTSTAAYASSSASDTYIYIDFSTALSGTFKLWTGMASGSPTATVTHSGGSSSVSLSSGENSLGTFTSVTRIAVNRGEAATHSFQAIAVDDVQLLDPVAVAGDAAATTFNPFNTDINTVRGQETGYATLNPLNKINVTLSNGNLESTRSSDLARAHSTIAVSSGKWYAEMVAGQDSMAGISLASQTPTTYPGGDANSYGYQRGGNKYNNGSNTSYGSTFTTGDLIGVALDLDGGTLTFYKNGISQGIAYSGLSGTFVFAGRGGQSSTLEKWNFGQKPFSFTPPDGFQPLNTANTRPVKVISRPDQYVSVNLWTGNGSTQTISDLGFSPDLVLIKARTGSAYHVFFDTVRGENMRLATSPSGAGESDEGANGVSAFGSNSFTVTDNSNGDYNVNGIDGGTYSGNGTYVGTAWKAGGNKGTFNKDGVGYASAAAAGLTGESGNITINGCSIGTKQGLSIIKYTPSADNSNFDLPHGLSQAPNFFFIKNLEGTQDFDVYFSGVTGTQQVLYLNETNGRTNTGVNVWNTVDSTKINVRGASFASSSQSRIVYFWHDVPGLQKFGTYESNNSTDGPFVELGFRPALLWVKEYSADGQAWHVIDNKRDTFNPVYRYVYINATSSEGGSATSTGVDFLSNGFKIRNNDNAYNNASSSFIYMAWAEAPTVDLYGGGANAR